MRVASVIKTDKNGFIVSMDSFGIYEEQISDDVTIEAEAKFIELSRYEGVHEDNAEDALEDGFVEGNNHIISIVWSNI